MLAAAREALVHHGVLGPSEELPPFFAKFGGNLVLGMLVYPNSGEFYVVKVAVQSGLDREYRGLSAAYAAMPRNASRPLGLTHHRSFPVLVSSGIRHKPLIPLHGRGSVQSFESGIKAFLATSVRAFRTLPGEGASSGLSEALEHASTLTPWPDWHAYLERIAPEVAILPRIPQHGDLSVNNIGVAGGQLIFFDWEDFGFVDLPGFDLAVLLLSLNDFDVRRLVVRLRTPSLERRLMQNGCVSLGMTTDLLLLLFPAYLSLFAQMKDMLGYGPEVARRAIAALTRWLSTEHAPDSRSAQRSAFAAH